MTVIHHSDLAEYRNPPGAVRTGATVRLRLLVEGEKPLSVTLRVFCNDVSQDYAMEFSSEYWQIFYQVPEQVNVLWYFFMLEFSSTDTSVPSSSILYYGAPGNRNQGEGIIYNAPCPSFQLTVYDRSFDTPAWFRGKTMYQIFPDRFRQGDPLNAERGMAYHKLMGREVVLHEHWNELPLYQPLPGKEYYSPCDFFGGDIRGIIDSLDYFDSLGITTLYLNPIVEAASNHRYDTADYMNVDPMLGSNEDFTELCTKAEQRGIRVMIDGVYSHTGSDSKYFNKLGNYSEPGAFQGTKSAYYKWYTFYSTRYNYKSWWGFDTLPEVNEQDKSWQRYVITGHDSVFSLWQSLGAHGLRLDVADELPDDVIELMRTYWKRRDANNILLGEVWEDATTKKSYGTNRRYALGKGLDSVMNYPFKEAIIAFLLNWINSFGLAEFLTGQRLNYPPPMYHALMNLLSSHDVPRVRTVLATSNTGDGMSREEQAAVAISPEEDTDAAMRQRLAVALQFTLPGVPCIYYGDEYGMLGYKDPFNRGTMTRRDPSLLPLYRQLSMLRQKKIVLQTGGASFFVDGDDTVGVLRYCLGKPGCSDAYDGCGVPAERDACIALINRGSAHISTIQLGQICAGMTESETAAWAEYPLHSAVDLLSGQRFGIQDRVLMVPIASQDFRILQLEK